MQDKKLYQYILGLASPWSVAAHGQRMHSVADLVLGLAEDVASRFGRHERGFRLLFRVEYRLRKLRLGHSSDPPR